MMPVLEDDALLYSLDDISGEEQSPDSGEGQSSVAAASKEQGTDKRVLELQEELERVRGQFADYQLAVKKSLEKELDKEDQVLLSRPEASPTGGSKKVREEESDYFTSYSYNSMWNTVSLGAMDS